MTTFSSLSDLVNITPMFTPTQFSQHHRIFRCLGLAGPPVLFSLNPSAGPTRQSPCFSSFSRTRRPAPRARTPLRRRSRAACSPLQAAAAPELFTAPPHALAHTRARCSCAAAPQPLARPSRACATHAPPLTATDGLSTHAQPPLLRSASHAQAFKIDLSSLHS